MKGRKTGGRTKGTPNKITQLNNAVGYNIQKDGVVPLLQYLLFGGQTPAQLQDGELLQLIRQVKEEKPAEALFFIEKLMQYVIPKRQSSSVDLTSSANDNTIEEQLEQLSHITEEAG